MTKLVNRAKMTTATTGTGSPVTLGSAVDGYQTFAAAGVADADVVRYVIEDGDAWEIGLGTYTASGTTLTRGSIESSNADNAINLTGNAVVYVSAAAADLQELVDFADNFVLPTADGSTGQVLTTNGAGTLSFTTITGYTDADVDAHLNTGTATTGEVLSWTGSDYDWVAVSGGADVVKLSSTTISTGVAEVAFTVPTGYTRLVLVINGLEMSSSSALAMRVSTDGGSTYLSGSTDYTIQFATQAGATLINSEYTGRAHGMLFGATMEAGNTYGVSGEINLFPNASGRLFKATGFTTLKSSVAGNPYAYNQGALQVGGTTSVVNNFKIYNFYGNNLTAGTITLYGYKS